MSIDGVVYYLIRKSSLMAFEWYHFYTIEVTISRDISKIKKHTIASLWALILEFECYVYHQKGLRKRFKMVPLSCHLAQY